MRSCDVISGSVMSGDDKSTRQPAAGQRRPRAPQLLQEALCTAPAKPKAARKLSVLPATRQPAAGQRRPRAPQLLQEALCTAPATRKPAAGQRRPRAPQLLQQEDTIFSLELFFPKGFFFLLFRILFEDSRRHLMF